jgi:nucleotide-binding universal stress UspA family protein
MHKIRNILLPTDLSSLSLSAVEYAVDLTEKYNARLHLLHILEKIPPILTIKSLELSEEKILSSIEQEARDSLRKIADNIHLKGENPIIQAIVKGIDHEEIIRYSKDHKIDMIVIATHGRSGIVYTLLGSVAEKVIRYSKCPVLVVTPPRTRKQNSL